MAALRTLVASLALTVLLACHTSKTPDRQSAASRDPNKEAWLRQAFREHSDLLDPFSLQSRAVVRPTDSTWCGEPNARNRMGAYTGWRPLAVRSTSESVAVLIEPDQGLLSLDSARLRAFLAQCGDTEGYKRALQRSLNETLGRD